MSAEVDLRCPTCGTAMEVLTADEHALPSNDLRVCAVCGTLAWTNEDGTVEARAPQKVEGEEYERLTKDMKFVSIEEERRRIQEILRHQRKPPVQ